MKMASNITKETFLYFGFGSNLLRQRLKMMNPSAVFKTTAKLKDYKLDFNYTEEPKDRSETHWCGCPATIEKQEGKEVWGVVWEIETKDLTNLDRQEGVDLGVYKPKEVVVEAKNGNMLTCRTYELLWKGDGDNRPSPQYLDVIILGAKQNELPEEYIQTLNAIEHNGHSGRVELYENVLKMIGDSC